MLKSVKSHSCVSQSSPQLPPLQIDQKELETFQENGAEDLAAICVAILRSVLEYTVAQLDITPFLPIAY